MMSEQSSANGPAPATLDEPPLDTPRVLAEEALAIDPVIDDPLLIRLAHMEGRPARSTRPSGLGVAGHGGDVDDCASSAAEQHDLYQALNKLDRAALCLSGGGIRSAAFGLGVIQALATHPRPHKVRNLFELEPAPHAAGAEGTPTAGHAAEAALETAAAAAARRNLVTQPEQSLLAQLHYLSTVSGGGYIGSWLSAWRYRASFDAVRNNLVGRPCGPDVEPHTLGWLRAYSNYLTPKLGALSGDTWAGAAISLRNLLLNWLIIVPAICAVILVLKMVATISIGIAVLPPLDRIAVALAVIGAILLVVALRFATRNRPTRRIEDMRDKLGRPVGADQGTFIRWDLVPATLAAGVFIQLGASNAGLAWVDHQAIGTVLLIAAIVGAILYALSWIAACPERRDYKDFWLWTVSGLLYGALLGTGAYVYNLAPTDGNLLFNDLLLPVMFGVPWVLVSQVLAEMIFVGLSSYQRQHDDDEDAASQDDSDSDREWLGRAAGWYLVTALGWFVVTFLVFAGSLVLTSLGHEIGKWMGPLGSIGGVVTALLGKSSLTPGPGEAPKGRKPLLSTRIILGIAAPLFAAALLIFLSAALDALLFDDSLVILLRYPHVQILVPLGWARLAVLLVSLVTAGAIIHAVAKRLKRRRWWLFVLVGPIFATVIVTLLQMALAFLLQWPANPFAPDPWAVLAPEGWESTGSTLIGLVITGIGVCSASRRVDLKRFWLLGFALPIIAILVILFVAAVAEWVPPLSYAHRSGLGIFSPGWFAIFGPLLIGLAIAAVVTWIASSCININRFSLHAVYRNRLVRAFLGSSRPQRNPDAFSGFDEDDNLPMDALWPKKADGTWPDRDLKNWRPFHVINMALNIVSTRHLSWQERKAESFTVSPLHSGSACKAYRRSDVYGGRKGISLGTAMAISGAAASPNMGYHSSPAITFLLALFNVRLGWWFGNPGSEGADTYRLAGPSFALRPLVEETFGLTTDEAPYVYLSDGGHFENLGLYEMVRRRCRHIIAVDAGADPDYGFQDLGNAVRKIAIDLGVTIRFHGLDKLKKRPEKGITGQGYPYHAIGEIDYPAADGGDPSGLGVILYIKAGYHGVEDAGIRAYAAANPTFPHESTIDQWFSESQFESYRALGFEITDGILNDVLDRYDQRKTVKLAGIFQHLRDEAEQAFRAAQKKTKEAAHLIQAIPPGTEPSGGAPSGGGTSGGASGAGAPNDGHENG
jgi:predicted acylesterase/phospholipase RssA